MLYCGCGTGCYAGELALSHITLNWWMERGYVTIERDSKPVKIPREQYQYYHEQNPAYWP